MNYFDLKIGDTLKAIRKEKNIPTVTLEKALDVTQATYHRYECGKAKIPFRYVMEFCTVCDISLTVFSNRLDKHKPRIQL